MIACDLIRHCSIDQLRYVLNYQWHPFKMGSSVAVSLIAKLLYYLISWVMNISMHVDINSSFGDMSFGGLLIVQFSLYYKMLPVTLL
jgi:hypothetical protein